jgi:hypothetical protein
MQENQNNKLRKIINKNLFIHYFYLELVEKIEALARLNALILTVNGVTLEQVKEESVVRNSKKPGLQGIKFIHLERHYYLGN